VVLTFSDGGHLVTREKYAPFKKIILKSGGQIEKVGSHVALFTLGLKGWIFRLCDPFWFKPPSF